MNAAATSRANWKRATLGDLVTFQRGFDITKAQQVAGPYPVVSSSGPASTHIEPKVEGPGVVIGRKGTLGTVFYLRSDYWPHDTTLWVRDFHGNVPRYVCYFLETLHLEQFDCGASNPTINRNHIHGLPIAIPEHATQEKIVAILSAYDDLIENNTRRITILEEMARLLHREWFVEFRFPGHESVRMVDSPLGLIPKSWKVVAFTEVADVLSGGTPKTSEPRYWGGEIPFFTPKDADSFLYVTDTEKSITTEGLDRCSSQLYPQDTVFITARGTVGKLALPAVSMAMNQSCYALRGRDGVSQAYLCLATLECVDALRTQTGGATFQTIVVDTFRRIQVVKPPSTVITEFSDVVQPVLHLIRSLLLMNRNLRRTRDLILPRLISGELDVEDLDIAMADAAA